MLPRKNLFMTFPNTFFGPIYEWGALSISGYFLFMGLAVACAFFGIFFTYTDSGEISRAKVLDAAILAVIGGLLGGKSFHILFENPDFYFEHPWSVITHWSKGFVLYGSFLGGAISIALFCKRHNLSIRKMLDSMALAMPLGIAVGRLGCLCSGCCYGHPTSLLWGISFEPFHIGSRKILPQVLAAHPEWVLTSLHPTQILESLTNLGIFMFLFLTRRKNRPDGWFFGEWLFLYAVARLGIEFLRADRRSFLIEGVLSQAQGLSLAIIAIFIALKVRHRRPSNTPFAKGHF
jgi:phosphatidylglycerol:prolipoprotein diacylglycerol transferase